MRTTLRNSWFNAELRAYTRRLFAALFPDSSPNREHWEYSYLLDDSIGHRPINSQIDEHLYEADLERTLNRLSAGYCSVNISCVTNPTDKGMLEIFLGRSLQYMIVLAFVIKKNNSSITPVFANPWQQWAFPKVQKQLYELLAR